MQRSETDQTERASGVLGDLLYPEGTTPVPETDWVCVVQSVAAKDPQALHALYERTYRLVFTLTLRITQNRQTAEELTVDVYHDVWRRASTYDPAAGSVVGWIMNQARSRAIDRIRFEGRKKRVQPHGLGPGQAPGGGPDHALDRREEARRLRQALDVLCPHEREAIETAFFSELTYAEAAARLNWPLGTVKTRIRAGLVKLRDALAKPVGDP